ncbi:EcoRII N-terminal effector-binding domain-containing protein [Povalibacter sp.]|uniref:EcoRII N-terminal effector-binding domain-containing protein n=1 Tax=Povalibacter sp. TaxID=1962978 RepID=UPI002F41900E
MIVSRITKTLSANDTGDTGGHQAGILVPKEPSILSFFPQLDANERNPRCHMVFEDDSGDRWELAFIYYNNRLFGGTRNEYRLTRMTRFIRQNQLEPGDEIVLEKLADGGWRIKSRRLKVAGQAEKGRFVLKLGSGWRVADV